MATANTDHGFGRGGVPAQPTFTGMGWASEAGKRSLDEVVDLAARMI